MVHAKPLLNSLEKLRTSMHHLLNSNSGGICAEPGSQLTVDLCYLRAICAVLSIGVLRPFDLHDVDADLGRWRRLSRRRDR